MSVRVYDPIQVARQFLFVREAPDQPNRGLRVEAIQKWCDGEPGDSWCCEFATMVLDFCYQGESPIPRTKLCQEVRALASTKGWLTTTPVPGDIYLRVKDDRAHHVGFVTKFAFGSGSFGSISGNTNESGGSNGDGVHEHDVIAMDGDVFVHLPENA